MLARDVMTRKVVTTTPQTTIAALTLLLLEKRVGAVPVVGAGGEVLGVVSEADLVPRLRGPARTKWWLRLLTGAEDPVREFVRTHSTSVADVMSRPAVTVTEDTPIEEIARILEARQIKRVLVVEAGRLVGIVSRRDLIRALAMRPPPPPAGPPPADAEIYRRVHEAFARTEWAASPLVQVGVAGGVVQLMGVVPRADLRRALRVLAEEIPGVRGVEDRLLLKREVPLDSG